MKEYIYRIPPEYRSLVKTRIAEIHHQRLRTVVPWLTILGVLFLGFDVLLILQEGPSRLLWIYVVLDVGFILLHGAFTSFLVRHSSTPNVIVYLYLSLALFWAAWSGNIEFQRTHGFNTVFLAVLSVSAMGLFSVRGISILLAVTMTVATAFNFLYPGPTPAPWENFVAFFALPFLAFAISRTLYAAVVENVITRHHLEVSNADLKQARLNLVRQEKLASLGVLSAGIAHEINNPLAFIKSNLSALERNLTSLQGDPAIVAENHAIFQDTGEGFRRIGEVVRALGTFARDVPLEEFSSYDVNEGVRSTLVMTRHETTDDIVVDTELSPLPLIKARGSDLNQVLLNLVMNAFQAVRTLPPGAVRLLVVRTRSEPGSVVVELANSGPLIPPEIREKIFEPFFSTKPPGAGMGLGLSLSWQIVHRHGGTLELLDGEPVTFRIRLPSG